MASPHLKPQQFRFTPFISIERNVLDDLRTDVFVQSPCYGTMLHEQVLFHGRGGYLHVQRLVLDEKVSCVSADTFAHNGCPRLYEAVLIIGRFDAV